MVPVRIPLTRLGLVFVYLKAMGLDLTSVTNIAHALRAGPTTFARVHSVVWMGGALEHPGNTSPTSEFNCFADPYAAQQVLDACKTGAFEVIMAPLDITTPHQIPFDDLIHPDYAGKAASSSAATFASTPLRQFVSAMLVRVRGLQASFGLPDAMEMHDPVAVWYALAHAGLRPLDLAQGWELQPREFKVERIGELTRGMCVVDRRGTGDDGEDRTKQERLKSGKDAEAAKKNGLPEKDETKGRMGEDIAKSKQLPWVIVKTPGKEVLRKTLLSRVFGMDV
jgi:inosine-uridine nucleoside N-ribohydrolase